jgi:proteasome lid subunit RPN8/RPN11
MATDAPARPEPAPDADARPDVLGLEPEGLPLRPFPGRESEYRVVLQPEAHRAILEHARSRADVELCGVLVGDLARDDDGPYLVIADIIRGSAARQGDTSVTFTHSTWERIHREMDAKHADRRIVGWYHTHPGFGVFLSEVDLFAHRNFFDAAWQVALVADPKADRVGLFYWSGGQIVRARRFWIGEEARWDADRPAVSSAPGKVAKSRPEDPRKARDDDARDRPDDRLDSWLVAGAVAVLLVLCLGLGYMNLTHEFRAAQLLNEVAALRRRADSDSAALARDLAFRLRDQLDRGGAPSAAQRAAFGEVVRLDPGRESSYARLLPELAPPPRPRADPEPPSRGGTSPDSRK